MESFKHYRIGPFARYLCVTPSFLKHYEDEGLISVVQQDNGYRYYAFPEAAHILEYMRLHSYGVPLKEMRSAVTGAADAAFDNIDRHADELQRKADRLQAVVDEHRRFRKWYSDMAGESSRWEVKKVDALYFLPHSEAQTFTDDPRVYELFPAWCDSMPLVKTGLYVKKDPKTPGKCDAFWGLCVTETNLRKAGIPVNDAVWRLSGCQSFVYHFCDLYNPTCLREAQRGHHPAFEKMRELGFKAGPDALITVDMKLEKDGVKLGFGRVVVPMAE